MYYKSLSEELNCPIITLTESHLNDTIEPSEVHIEGFQTLRGDRCSRKRGGVITYVRDDLTITMTEDFSNEYCESTLCYIPSIKLAIITVYRPQACPTEKFVEVIDYVRNWLENFENNGQLFPSLFMSGDYNFPFMNTWDHDDITGL
jgi:exonuclease III